MFKVLYVSFEGLRNFQSEFCLDLTASDRITKCGENVSHIVNAIYTENVIAFVGINASGKTTALRLLKAVLLLLSDNIGLDQIPFLESLCKKELTMDVIFFFDGKLYRLVSIIEKAEKGHLRFKDEKIYQKRKISKKKEDRFIFFDDEIILERKNFVSGDYSILKDNDSIVAALTKNVDISHLDTIGFTNYNYFSNGNDANSVFLSLLDNSIENIDFGKENQLSLKFKGSNEDESIILSALYAEQYISSGTIRGLSLLQKVQKVLMDGGYLLIDEIENHLNKKIVQMIINLFQHNEINKNGATLIFTTHYAEITDTIERKDNIYVFLKTESGKCQTLKYSDRVKRNDIKKSEVLLSNYINGTSPSYEEIEAVKAIFRFCK